MKSQLNDEQFATFVTVHDAVISPQPASGHTTFYLDGKTGRGKSFVAAALSYITRASSDVIVTGSSALSIAGYERCLAAHSIFGIPITQVQIYTSLLYHWQTSNIHHDLLVYFRRSP